MPDVLCSVSTEVTSCLPTSRRVVEEAIHQAVLRSTPFNDVRVEQPADKVDMRLTTFILAGLG